MDVFALPRICPRSQRLGRACRLFRSVRLPFALALLASVFGLAVAGPQAVGEEVPLQRYPVEIQGQKLTLPFYATAPIDAPDESIRRIVFSIHGVAINADVYFRNMLRAAERVPEALDRTLIIAPTLMNRSYAEDNPIEATDVFWNWSNEAFWGGQSGSSEKHPREVDISSFKIFDRLLSDLTEPGLFPNLEIIVLAGHSGGGQFTNRYAISSRFEDEVARPRNIHVRYIVGQPSHHACLTNERVDPASRTRSVFRVPSDEEIASCPGYDDYGWGMEELEYWPYLAAVGPERMLEQYAWRDVVYLHGMEDSDPEGRHLARGCASMVQGAHRLERGMTYYNYIYHLYGERGHNHRLALVPRVGHDHGALWASDSGLLYIFDHAVNLRTRGR